MAIAAHPSLVVDCPDPRVLAEFYGALLGWSVEVDPDGGWAEIRPEEKTQCYCFQRVEGYQAPDWPGQERPQQAHLDVMVRSFEEAEPEVLALGATRHEVQPGTTFRVYLDPAGHPFCLCLG
ncbi:VOC family protein [Nocardioides acrostichi]|uniref:VOC family protein n=1 Tax=Nocardioides acrostichi TaxID=2784339 RepID=A0A930V307_9ACTN|nr:VOC family protein [Nocardioides acrostichi]MBF4162872.1 VOC family protein [Nocardioides acrostichi]